MTAAKLDTWRTIRVTARTFERLRKQAEREGVAVSRLLDSLINTTLDDEERRS